MSINLLKFNKNKNLLKLKKQNVDNSGLSTNQGFKHLILIGNANNFYTIQKN